MWLGWAWESRVHLSGRFGKVTSIALALALAGGSVQNGPSQNPSWFGGRIYTGDDVHLGLRPAFFVDNEAQGRLEVGAGFTLQVTFR